MKIYRNSKELCIKFVMFILLMQGFYSYSQPGLIDTTFRVGGRDLIGFNATVNCSKIINSKIVVGGSFSSFNGTSVPYITMLNILDGTIDSTFNPGSGFNGQVLAIEVQTDGKILVGGEFTSYNGTVANRIIRLNPNGDIDLTFNSGNGFNNRVRCIAIQSGGKLMIGGEFTSYNGTVANRIIRLNPNGDIDLTFNSGNGFNQPVYSLLIQNDGKVVVGGNFTSYSGVSVNYLVRLNTNGYIDNTFSSGTTFNNKVNVIISSTYGQLIVGGTFTAQYNTQKNRIARINSNGTLDNTFDIGTGFDNEVKTISITQGKILVGGDFTSFNGITNLISGILRLNNNGTIDNSFKSYTNGFVNTINVFSNKYLLGGAFTLNNSAPIGRIVRLEQNGVIDTSFNIPNGASDIVYCTTLLPNGKILAAGSFYFFNKSIRQKIARLNSDGSVDFTFNAGNLIIGTVLASAVQSDGKILLGGSFNVTNPLTIGLGNSIISGIIRLNADGTFDQTFLNFQSGIFGTGGGDVSSIAVQSDGKIIIAGSFTSYYYQTTTNINKIARLNSNGSLDNTFTVGSGFNYEVNSLVLQSDGKIVAVGKFNSYNGTNVNKIARINTNGTIDLSFNPNLGLANNDIFSLAIQDDNKIIIGGFFTAVNGVSLNRIARLNQNGSLDSGFNPGNGFDQVVYSIKVQSDGKILVGGQFTSFNGISRPRIAKLNSNGSVDSLFIPDFGFNQIVRSINIQNDQKIIVNGEFTSFNNFKYNRIIRLLNNCSEPNAPVSLPTQSFCNNGVISDLTAIGNNIKWYPFATGGSQLNNDLNLVNGLTYFATQILNGCESENRTAVTVTINSTQTPNGNTTQTFCGGSTIDNLTATGTAIKWYPTITGGTQLANTTALVSGTTYFATQTINGCESQNRLAVTVTVNTTNSPTGATTQTFCNSATISNLSANGTSLKWYPTLIGGTQLANTTALANGSIYYVTQTINGCESQNRLAVTVTINTTNSPIGTSTQTFCGGSIIANLTATGTAIKWYPTGIGGSQLSNTETLVNGSTYYATQTINGCESQNRLAVTVTINTPTVPTGSSTQTFCGGSTIANLSATGTAIKWYSSSNGGSQLSNTTSLVNGSTYYATQTVNGCESQIRFPVLVSIVNTPQPSGTSSQTFCNAATVNNLSATGTSIQWYNAASGGTALAASTALVNGQNYYASQTENNCESQQRLVVSVTINSPTAPSGLATQNFCNSATVGDLSATGTNIQWFNTATGGTPLATSTVLGNGNYFASQTINNCESANRLTVTVSVFSNPNTNVTLNANTLTASQQGATYQWLNCDNNLSPISGANQMSYTPLVSGNYAVSITINGCTSTSNCTYVQVLTGSIDENKDSFIINLYPNPNSGTFTFETTLTGKYLVINNLGQIIAEFNVEYPSQKEVNLDKPSKGVYYIKHAENQTRPTKLIVH